MEAVNKLVNFILLKFYICLLNVFFGNYVVMMTIE